MKQNKVKKWDNIKTLSFVKVHSYKKNVDFLINSQKNLIEVLIVLLDYPLECQLHRSGIEEKRILFDFDWNVLTPFPQLLLLLYFTTILSLLVLTYIIVSHIFQITKHILWLTNVTLWQSPNNLQVTTTQTIHIAYYFHHLNTWNWSS